MKLKTGELIVLKRKIQLRDELRKTKVEILPVKRSKVFSGGAKAGLTANVEYTSDELSFLQLRSGEYTKIFRGIISTR